MSFTETDMDRVPEPRAEFGDLVPVVRVDGKELGHRRIDEAELRRGPRTTGRGVTPPAG